MHATLVIRFELMHFIISLTINWQLTLSWPEQKRGLTRICCQGLWELLDCKNFQLKTSSNIRLWVNLNLCLMRIYTVCFGEPEKIRSHHNILFLWLKRKVCCTEMRCQKGLSLRKIGFLYHIFPSIVSVRTGKDVNILFLTWLRVQNRVMLMSATERFSRK